MKPITQFFRSTKPLPLDCKEQLNNLTIAYQTYGVLDKNKTNAVLVCHALSGDAHAAFEDEEGKKGWWDGFIGPGKTIDTNTMFVICSNVIGSCKGSSGPTSINIDTGQPYASSFPIVTIGDMVRAQKQLIDALGIGCLHAVVGASMGGMQALEWTVQFPESVEKCVCIASTAKLSAQGLAFGAIGRSAILMDPEWQEGSYHFKQPANGLALARMLGHITYLSHETMNTKFGRKMQNLETYQYDLSSEFQIESYLKYQGEKFIERFDANAYIYLSKAMSYFDIPKQYGSLEAAFAPCQSEFLILSISSDWIYPSAQSKEIAKTLMRLNKIVSYCDINSPYGHDAFLIDLEPMEKVIRPFLR